MTEFSLFRNQKTPTNLKKYLKQIWCPYTTVETKGNDVNTDSLLIEKTSTRKKNPEAFSYSNITEDVSVKQFVSEIFKI